MVNFMFSVFYHNNRNHSPQKTGGGEAGGWPGGWLSLPWRCGDAGLPQEGSDGEQRSAGVHRPLRP